VRLVFIIDPIQNLDPTHDTSVAIMEAQAPGHQVWVTQANLSVVAGKAFLLERAAETGAVGEGRWVEAAWYQLSDHTSPSGRYGRRIHADRSTSNKFPHLYAHILEHQPPKPWSSTLLKG